KIETNRGPARRGVPERRVRAPAHLLAVVAIAVELGIGERRVDVDRAVDLAGADVVLQEAERAGLAADLHEPRVVSGLADEIDGAAERIAAEGQRVGALVDLDALG